MAAGAVASVAAPAAKVIAERAPGFKARVGIVLGSGLGEVGGIIEDAIEIPYADLPNFPVSTVSGHAGKLILGTLAGCVLCYDMVVPCFTLQQPGMRVARRVAKSYRSAGENFTRVLTRFSAAQLHVPPANLRGSLFFFFLDTRAPSPLLSCTCVRAASVWPACRGASTCTRATTRS